MISSLNGTLISKGTGYAVVECGGVGLKCFITENTYMNLGKIGEKVFLHTFLAVREDALDLYGFSSESELEMFKMITTVNGVGFKIGLAILSEFTPESIVLFIAGADAKSLTAASGVGIKLAQRIVLELKDKIGSFTDVENSIDYKAISSANTASNTKEAIEALVSLGFSQSEASLSVGRLDSSLSVDELIKSALKSLSRGNNS